MITFRSSHPNNFSCFPHTPCWLMESSGKHQINSVSETFYSHTCFCSTSICSQKAPKHLCGISYGTQQNTTIVDNCRQFHSNQPWGNATTTTEAVKQNTQFEACRPTNLYLAALQTNPIHQAFPGKSYQFQSGWTEVTLFTGRLPTPRGTKFITPT
ncbi:hypothetical protein MJO28_007890 [Puccinia striiformis f. sp. tritici]|uniref:Uncharacterized protein n=1 Tax=Puccinia striiformis f. sp. tritici TaxID=168172 RepID=A0ACC0E9L2_9BASI|nr:hypothetical protein MJO28_007890 [Puccinia striiformis f. sp. tritici]